MSAGDTPLVSILIRSMDRPTLDRAIDSAMKQTWPNLEIVVAACGSSHRELPDSIAGRDVRLIVPSPERALPRPDAVPRVPRNKSLREDLDLIRARVKSAKADHVAH